MSAPQDDFDARLRAEFERQADGAPRADLSRAALRQAGRIRTRRRVAAAAAAAVLAAIVVPVGLGVIEQDEPTETAATQPVDTPRATTSTDASKAPSPTGSTARTTGKGTGKATQQPTASVLPTSRATLTEPAIPIDIVLASLPQGEPPTVGYIDDRTFWADGTSSRLDLAPKGYPYSATVLPDGTRVGWYRVDATANFGPAEGLRLDDATTVAGGPVVDADGSVLWAEQGVDQYGNGVGDITLRYGDTLDAPRTVSLVGVTLQSLVAVRDGVAVANVSQGNQSMVVRVDMLASSPRIERPWPTLRYVSAVSPDASLLATHGDKIVPPNDSPCAAVVEAATLTRLWESCDWAPVRFSPDGSRLLAQPVGTEGIGPRAMAVLDSRSGSVLQELTADQSTFGRADFESVDTVDVVVVEDGGRAAIVRCTVAQGCELATDPLAPALDSLSDPYTLTPAP